jgi:hypothetical protein
MLVPFSHFAKPQVRGLLIKLAIFGGFRVDPKTSRTDVFEAEKMCNRR